MGLEYSFFLVQEALQDRHTAFLYRCFERCYTNHEALVRQETLRKAALEIWPLMPQMGKYVGERVPEKD